MSGGRPKTSGKSHNESSKTYLTTAGRDQASTSTVLPVTGKSTISADLKRKVLMLTLQKNHLLVYHELKLKMKKMKI